MIRETLNWLISLMGSNPFLLTVETASLILKSVILAIAIQTGLRAAKIPRPWFYLLAILVGSMFSNLAWIVTISRKLFFPNLDYRPVLFLVRIAWVFAILLYQSLALFIDSLTDDKSKIRGIQKVFITTSLVFASLILVLAIVRFDDANNRPTFEFQLLEIGSIYIFAIIIPSLITAIRRIRSVAIPRILKKQLKILIQGTILPIVLSDFIQLYPFRFYANYIASNYTVVGLSSALLTFGIFFSARKVMGLRFLNFQAHVQSTSRFNFIDDFKDVLEKLSQSTSARELVHITQLFFKAAFDIHQNKSLLYIRTFENVPNMPTDNTVIDLQAIPTVVENFIDRHDNQNCTILTCMLQNKILIYDEVAFSNFYQESEDRTEIIKFLDEINADIFLPIFQKHKIIAFIVIERNARPNHFYSNVERDEMVVFGSYLGNIINLLQHQNLDVLLAKHKELEEELFRKHQEVNQFRESIRAFSREGTQRKIGILFYKSRRFIFGNQAAKELLGVNINQQDGHVYTKALKNIAQQVEDYQTPQHCFIKDPNGNKLICSAIPNLERSNVIITVYYAEASELIKNQIEKLYNPSEWDYLLYLETTQSGKLITQLIPGNGPELLNFKIQLLKLSLSKKALLLEIPEEDLQATVEILHHISLREQLYTLKLQGPVKDVDTAIKLFGMNPLFGTPKEEALLQQLNNIGTLYIQNIHFLDLESQQHLAEFMRYGYFHMYKSDQKSYSNVRIICSTNKNLYGLVQEGKFSKALFGELKKTTLSMPSLLTLSSEEFSNLAEGFTSQAIESQDLQHLLTLTEREKRKLHEHRPVSLKEFRTKIEGLLVSKSKENDIYQETTFDPAYHVSDPELVEAARLGRKALRDPRIMEMLWNKFKNQNKIANLLGVNRSSINRRLQAYNLRR